jgi:hypothetical protein
MDPSKLAGDLAQVEAQVAAMMGRITAVVAGTSAAAAKQATAVAETEIVRMGVHGPAIKPRFDMQETRVRKNFADMLKQLKADADAHEIAIRSRVMPAGGLNQEANANFAATKGEGEAIMGRAAGKHSEDMVHKMGQVHKVLRHVTHAFAAIEASVVGVNLAVDLAGMAMWKAGDGADAWNHKVEGLHETINEIPMLGPMIIKIGEAVDKLMTEVLHIHFPWDTREEAERIKHEAEMIDSHTEAIKRNAEAKKKYAEDIEGFARSMEGKTSMGSEQDRDFADLARDKKALEKLKADPRSKDKKGNFTEVAKEQIERAEGSIGEREIELTDKWNNAGNATMRTVRDTKRETAAAGRRSITDSIERGIKSDEANLAGMTDPAEKIAAEKRIAEAKRNLLTRRLADEAAAEKDARDKLEEEIAAAKEEAHKKGTAAELAADKLAAAQRLKLAQDQEAERNRMADEGGLAYREGIQKIAAEERDLARKTAAEKRTTQGILAGAAIRDMETAGHKELAEIEKVTRAASDRMADVDANQGLSASEKASRKAALRTDELSQLNAMTAGILRQQETQRAGTITHGSLLNLRAGTTHGDTPDQILKVLNGQIVTLLTATAGAAKSGATYH